MAATFSRGFGRSYIYFSGADAAVSDLAAYWKIYGGLRALVRSPALWIAVVATLLSEKIWTHKGWSDLPLSIVPNLLGFSLGALAIVFAFPTSALFKVIAEGGRSDSYYMDLASKFLHFIIVQVIAISLAIIGKSISWHIIAFFGILSLYYSIACAFLTALALFGAARLYNKHAGLD